MVRQGVRKGDDEFQHIAQKKDCLEVEIIYFTRGEYCPILASHLGFVILKKKIQLQIHLHYDHIT